jgi:hypothetical protein
LLAKSEFLEFLKSVFLSLAIYNSVLQDWTKRSLDHSLVGAVAVATILEIPAVSAFVELKTRVVVAFVEVLQN